MKSLGKGNIEKLPRFLKYTLSSLVALMAILVAYYYLWFLRLPDRQPLNDTQVFQSPANGKVVAVVKWHTDTLEWQKDDAAVRVLTSDVDTSGYLIAIEMNVMNVHYQRAPVRSTLISKEYTRGKFKNALVMTNKYGLRLENERNALLFETEDKLRYKVVQVAGLLARRIIDYVAKAETVEQGEIIGLIKLGSQVGLLLPDKVDIQVKPGDKVIEGVSVVARRK
jgi:phosphatidylserine decarboxylase